MPARWGAAAGLHSAPGGSREPFRLRCSRGLRSAAGWSATPPSAASAPPSVLPRRLSAAMAAATRCVAANRASAARAPSSALSQRRRNAAHSAAQPSALAACASTAEQTAASRPCTSSAASPAGGAAPRAETRVGPTPPVLAAAGEASGHCPTSCDAAAAAAAPAPSRGDSALAPPLPSSGEASGAALAEEVEARAALPSIPEAPAVLATCCTLGGVAVPSVAPGVAPRSDAYKKKQALQKEIDQRGRPSLARLLESLQQALLLLLQQRGAPARGAMDVPRK